MAKGLTRREFLKLSGQAVAATGAACAASGLGSPGSAEAAGEVLIDGGEMVAKVGDTFATIQLVPRFTKTKSPKVISAKVQYSTDPALTTYSEAGPFYAEYLVGHQKGRHVGGDGSSTLVASKKYKFLSRNWEIEPGDKILNRTDGSKMIVTQVISDNTIAGELSGGARNCWNNQDRWKLYRTYYRLELKLTGLLPDTKYYYRVLVSFSGDPWPAPRPVHSFRTRRVAGQSFRFAIWADPHRTNFYNWPCWDYFDVLLASLRQEDMDFVIDVGDTWVLTNGDGKPRSQYFPELYSTTLRPARNGYEGTLGISDVCADCGYYLARGNHEGLSDFDKPKRRRNLVQALKMFVPNPNGDTYPQGGSADTDYDQGYFAFEWGDALFIVLDVIKYKGRQKLNPDPSRFHIGDAQLAWLTSVLEQATQQWKFIFFHHIFGGANKYGRGGATYAFQYEQAQVQALAEQYGAHIFYGHDHLVAKGMANGVLYYCCGSAAGGRTPVAAGDYYPEGYLPTCYRHTCCENFGYVVVDVSPGLVRVQYKNYQGVPFPEAEVVLT